LSSPEPPPGLSPLHRAFDRLYPAIRFTYERLFGHAWFSQIEPRLWLGGAPTYQRDYEAIRTLGITAVLDTRAERSSQGDFYDAHGISHRRFLVPDVTVPDEAVLTEAVAWIEAQLADDRTVLVHCAKGRGRSATVLAAYLMKTDGYSFDAVRDLLQTKRALVKLEDRHRRVLESWVASTGHVVDPG
jgi:rhodanese-related sulfurtransferase